jgi:hypothetical protein
VLGTLHASDNCDELTAALTNAQPSERWQILLPGHPHLLRRVVGRIETPQFL